MKVLVIGGAGYIGSHVVLELLGNGHKVSVYDNLSGGSTKNLFKEAEFIQGDILDFLGLLDAMNGIDAIVHLAAFKAAGESMIKPEKYSVNNISGTIQILNAASEKNVKYIVFSSSAAVYGEPVYLPIDEKHPLNPENYYGFTKLQIELILSWYEKLKGLRFAALRYFNACGYDKEGRVKGLELAPENLVPIVMEAAIGKRECIEIFGSDYDTPDGTCIRDYIHVSDLASAHCSALDYISKNNKSITCNLGSETGISVKEMIEAARKITGKPLPSKIVGRRAGDPVKIMASCDMAKELLGWSAKYSDVETLLQTTWDMYKGDSI
ncbi:MAG: UDP-glucose 4-epimerase GalE [Termitinemataceae bacterium]|nr:MAG: UDP-glucose 4-epimerase GalE [Termitinemataceae bacterium]